MTVKEKSIREGVRKGVKGCMERIEEEHDNGVRGINEEVNTKLCNIKDELNNTDSQDNL